jgi:hypothetical protein
LLIIGIAINNAIDVQKITAASQLLSVFPISIPKLLLSFAFMIQTISPE